MSWFRNAIVYQIFVDRFSRGLVADARPASCEGPVFCGGNIRGIIERLDYLDELGVTAIWLSPFNTTSAYHGYHITDFFGVDPRFGTLEDVQELIAKAHGRGMKLIMDFVPNHMSSQHPFFVDAQKNKASEYRQWFYFQKWPNRYRCFMSFGELPKINLDYAPARDHIIGAAKYWLAMGFDALRLDHVFGPSHRFWAFFRESIKHDFPDALLIGEAFGVAGLHKIAYKDLASINLPGKFWLRLFQASDRAMRAYTSSLDGALDFTFQAFAVNYVARPNRLHPHWLLNLRLKAHYAKFPPGFFLPAFLDNHDINRFLFECGDNKERLKEAAKLQFAQNQPVVIYQGTEVGVSQEKDIADVPSYGDLQVRHMMPWNNFDAELLAFYKDLIKQRRQKTA